MRVFHSVSAAMLLVAMVPSIMGQARKAAPLETVRLYVFNCGTLHFDNADAYSLKKEEVAATDMSVPCFLVAHPRGTMIWDAGIIPDTAFTPGGGTVTAGIATSSTPLLPQLAAAGYSPGDITHLALSHYHSDHVANANAFAGSIWIEHDIQANAKLKKAPQYYD
jgi:N-acyl homoserine lactone hydrolase